MKKFILFLLLSSLSVFSMAQAKPTFDSRRFVESYYSVLEGYFNPEQNNIIVKSQTAYVANDFIRAREHLSTLVNNAPIKDEWLLFPLLEYLSYRDNRYDEGRVYHAAAHTAFDLQVGVSTCLKFENIEGFAVTTYGAHHLSSLELNKVASKKFNKNLCLGIKKGKSISLLNNKKLNVFSTLLLYNNLTFENSNNIF